MQKGNIQTSGPEMKMQSVLALYSEFDSKQLFKVLRNPSSLGPLT